jgi:hypothetical protein
MKERKKGSKQILPFVAFFNRHFRVLFFDYFSVRLMGTCRTWLGEMTRVFSGVKEESVGFAGTGTAVRV